MTRGRRLLRVARWAVLALVLIPGAYVAYLYTYAWGAGRYWDRAEPEVHLIPAGYTGPVLIIYDSLGAPVERQGEARLYRIPMSGILRTQFPPNEGWGRPDYFYVDSLGHRTVIAAGTPCDDSLPGDPVQACLMGQTRYGNNGPRYQYSGYVVSRNAARRALYDQGERVVARVLFGLDR